MKTMSVLSLVSQDTRKDFHRKETLATVYSSNSRLNLLNKRKKLNPLVTDMSNQSLSNKYVTQRVLSAKTHRVKALQNQLADAHYHLQELSNENKVLRALQKKLEIALQRYENSNAELPQVLNSHSEEMRAQQSKCRHLKQQLTDATRRLKDRDMQLQLLRDEHQHLLDLSKDRNLLEREKLQAQVSELSLKVQQQNDTISTLQRRIVLEQKNFQHQLQNEISKHKNTRNDLDLAITNADKLSTIIEMKERMLSTVASRVSTKSPTKSSGSTLAVNRPAGAGAGTAVGKPFRIGYDERASGDQLSRLCENSRSLSSALSHDEETSSSLEPKSRNARTRSNSNSTISRSISQTRKNSKGSDDMIDIAKAVQDGMAELSLYEEEIDFRNTSPDEVQKKIETMKSEFMNKIRNNEDPLSRKPSLRKKSIEESIEEQVIEEEIERPKSRGTRNSYYDEMTIMESSTTVTFNDYKSNEELARPKRETSAKRPIDKYCNDIIHDIEKSNRVIDKHVKAFSNSKIEGEKLVQQLQVVDKINDYVNAKGEISSEAFEELNNNFKMLTDQVVLETIPAARKRSMSGRKSSRADSRSNLFGDSSMSNQDLLEDLLGKK